MMKLTLPKEPVDRFEIKYWSYDGDRIIETRIVYHVNTKWADLYPDDSRGVDFVNHWQIFHNGNFSGRTHDGWEQPLRWTFAHDYATRKEAVQALVLRLKLTAKNSEERLSDLKEKIAEYEKELKNTA